MESKKTIEQCIYWQRHVAAQSRDPAQIARCLAAIARLEAKLAS